MAVIIELFIVFLVLNAIKKDIVHTADISDLHPVRDFSRHTLIKPRIYHGREKRQISTSKEENGNHIAHLTITIPTEANDYILDLTLNKQLIPKGYFVKTQSNGSHKITKPTSSNELELCHYNGKVRNKANSWVALSTCDGITGVFHDGNDLHYIEKGLNHHFLYKHSDLVEHNKTCGYGGDAMELQKTSRIHRYKRDVQNVRGPYNANKESKFVELVLVVDNREYKEMGESTSRVEQHCKNIANIINGLYAPLNIFIALVGVIIWTEHDEINFSTNGDMTLTSFLHYRRLNLVKQHPNDNAQLLTKFSFDNGVVGKALKGPICTYEYSGGVNTDHSPVVGLVATTVAHEMGHNFGMEHDTNECKCPDDRCIMAPSSSTVAPTHWSSCSLNYLLLAFTHGMDYCLKNKPDTLFDSPVCGNGFVEAGEQCDCGLPEHCDNTCCNASTCMLYSNASCATGECCDLTTCKPKNAGTLCRSADYECDLPEYCTGQSEYCPLDIYKMDTEVCDNGRAFCYHGFCRTRTDQCKLLWGETGKSSDEQCYKMNVKGTRHGNCGYNKFNQSFSKCNEDNVLCGMLHCKHLNERLEFGMESVSILSHTFINLKGSIVPCRTAIVDLGINQVDPGLAPDGAKCGEGRMCVNQRCLPVDSLKKGHICQNDCNGNGWCNSLGHCHCKDGFAPPFCEDPGPGGSEDSGPASDPNAHKDFVYAMFIVFLGIIPAMAIFALIMYYMKHNVIKFGHPKTTLTNQPMSKSPTKSRTTPFTSSDTSKRGEDNHSLLPETVPVQNEFFGHFKGFSLTPMKKQDNEPVRVAPPPPPTVPAVIIKNPNKMNNFLNRSVSRAQSFKNNISEAINSVNSNATAPALPPPNPGSTAKPIISSPILENSTCTAKELISPLKHVPKVPVRAAPETPSLSDIEEKKETTLNRIASFLQKNDKKPTNSLPRQSKAAKIDKTALRNIEISNPIPQSEINVKALPVDKPETKAVIMRAQSMRGNNVTSRPAIQTFGSMRQPMKRPMSIPSGNRPKSPPPPRPPVQKNEYDDCLNKAPLAKLGELSPTNSDNIYAVIEESPVSPESVAKTSSGSTDSMGLLGEIVSEIQNRNFDSIYSTSTLARKKKEKEAQDKVECDYVNSPVYKSPESVYSNMNSSTSSGYIHPSAVNKPVVQEKPNLSTFKDTYKPFITRQQGPLASTFKTSPQPTKKSPTKTPTMRTRKPSPARTAPKKPPTNSPDLVTSCKPGSKPPDVLNASVKKPMPSVKPVVNGVPKGPLKTSNKSVVQKTANVKLSKTNSDPKLKTTNVAKLQQKFENKNAKTKA